MDSQDQGLRELTDRVAQARSSGQPLEIRGAGSKRFYGEAPRGEVLDMTALSGISSYEPTELVVTARAGTPLAHLEAALEEKGQCLPFEPPRFAAGGTVGGMVAAGLAGPARASVGSVRDHVLGMTLLNGRGEMLSFGGQVAKNVAGYDISRLIVGSLGILGVVCEVSMKVLPVPAAAATLHFDCRQSEALEKLNAWRCKPLPINASVWHDDRLYVRTTASAAQVRATAAGAGGHATLMRAADKSAGVFSPLSEVLMRIHRNLKQAFDPQHIFNPGRLYAGL